MNFFSFNGFVLIIFMLFLSLKYINYSNYYQLYYDLESFKEGPWIVNIYINKSFYGSFHVNSTNHQQFEKQLSGYGIVQIKYEKDINIVIKKNYPSILKIQWPQEPLEKKNNGISKDLINYKNIIVHND
jgi:hypothetical protein